MMIYWSQLLSKCLEATTEGLVVDTGLGEVLRCLKLEVNVFQSGPVALSTNYQAQAGLAHIHVLRRGCLRLASPEHRTVRVDEPSLILYIRPVSHSLSPLGGETFMLCGAVNYGYGRVNPLLSMLPEVVVLSLAELPATGSVLDAMFYESEFDYSGRQAVLDRLMEVLFVYALRTVLDRGVVAQGLLAGLADPRLSKALAAIHRKPQLRWTLSSLAATAGMSRARFAERFHRILGRPPAAYLGEWRICLAQSLLLDQKNIEWTAQAVGYSSASALSRAFRKQTGVTPKDWLKHQRALAGEKA